jgi:hypothetical protein
MIADTALDDQKLALRERHFKLKIAPVKGCSLIGFAGNADLGPAAIAKASLEEPGPDALCVLLAEHAKHKAVDFAYAHIDGHGAHLFRVSDGAATEVPTLHIGQHVAFEAFQRIRHDASIDHPPDAIMQMLYGVRDPQPPPSEGLRKAILALQRLVLLRQDMVLGGLVVPYVLSNHGTSVCMYGFSVTDRIVSHLVAGDQIPHGTAAGGGFGVSLTELREKDGIVVYWPQKPGGRVYIRSADWYSEHHFEGSPRVFRDTVRATLGRDVDVWFGDEAAPPPQAISVLADQHGRPRITVAEANGVVSFNWIQSTEDSFSIGSQIRLERKSG